MTRFIVLANEALGLSYDKVLDASFALIDSLMQESAYINNERNRAADNTEDGEIEGEDFEWVELPTFDDPSKTQRYKRYFNASKFV